MCECGYLREQHLEDAAKPPLFLGKEWDPNRHIQEMPTDAFGDIHFTGLGQKTGKVICFSPVWYNGSQCSDLAQADEMQVFPSWGEEVRKAWKCPKGSAHSCRERRMGQHPFSLPALYSVPF